jgi:hypothetical protein
MAKYRITSLPGYTKRVPLSKAQFGGLNKFLKGGDPCPPDKQVYPQFSKFGCISSSQYNKLIEQTKNNLLKQEVYKKTKLDDFNTLRKSRTDGNWDLAEKLLVEWKAKYPGNSSVCPKDDCPEYDLVLEPDPVIEEIPEEIPEIPELSLGTYPNPPIYHQTPTEIEIPTVRVEKGNTKSIKFNTPKYHKNNYLTGKTDAPPFHGKKPHHINYRSRRLDFDRKDIPRLIPSLVQKFTGYDDAYMNGYYDEEGNYIPGEFEKAEEENRQINFKGKSSLRDKKEQKRYNKEWEQHNIEKAGIREYNLNLIKEAGISPEEYVKKYGEYKYGGLHKFVAGGPSACPPGQYWNGTKCVPNYGINPLSQSAINNFVNNTTVGNNARIAAAEKKGMAYQSTLDELNTLYAEKAIIDARNAAIKKKADNKKRNDAEAKQRLLDEERDAQINPNKYYSETIQNVAGNSGVPQTQLALDAQIGAKQEYHQKRKFVTDNYLSANRDALVNEAARSLQNSSNLTYEQALAKAQQDEALLYRLAEKHTPTDSQHLTNLANKQDFYDYKNSRNDQIKSIDPNDPDHISFEDPGTLGGYLDHAKDIVFNPLDAIHYAMNGRGEKMPYNFDEYEKMKKQTGYRDGADQNLMMQGIDFATWFNPLGLYGQGIKMIEPTAESIVNVYNNPTLENAGTAAWDIGMNALTLAGAKSPLKFLAEENAAANVAREAEVYDFGSRLNRFNRENYTGPQYYSEQPIQNSFLLGPSSGSVSRPTLNAGPLLLPIGTANEVRSAAGSGIGSTPLLNTGTIGFNPTVSLDDVYNNISNNNRATLSRFVPEQNITREPTLYDTETDLFLNQNPFMDYEEYQSAVNNAPPPTSLQYQEYQAAVNESERSNMANAADTRTQAEAIEAFEIAKSEQRAAKANYFQNPSSQDAIMRRELANRELAVAEENVSIAAPNYRSQPPVNNTLPPPPTSFQYQVPGSFSSNTGIGNVANSEVKTAAIDAYETARAQQQAARENYLANPYNGDVTAFQFNYTRLANADEALLVAEENLALMAPDYISQPYVPSSANLNTTTGPGGVTVYGATGNTQPIMSGSFTSGNANLNSGAISSAPLPAQSTAFDGLSQTLGTSTTEIEQLSSVNYSPATIDALTQYRPNNSFHNGQTIETQLSNITDPVDYANRLRELESIGSINRTMYDELAEGLIAHIDNTPNPSIRSDAALDIINVDPDIVYTGSKLPENEVFSWLNNTSETEMDQALSNYNYDFDNIANFFADPNLSNEVRTVALNQIKDDFRYITEFGETNPNARPIDFSTGEILSPKLLKANNIADYKTLKINPKSKDVLKKTMYEDVELTTDTIPYSRTLNTSLPHLKNRSHIISDKELTKQLEAYEEAYAAVKGKGGKAEDLITAKLEDLRGTKYLRTIYADQMKAAGKDPSEILEYGIISSGKYSKSLIDKNGVVIGTVEFYPSTFEGLPYSKISETGLNYKYHGHSLKHGKFKTWEQSQEALTKRYLDESLSTIPAQSQTNPIVIKGLTKQAEARAIETIKQLQINNNNRFGEALYSGVNASLLETRGRLATKEGFANTTLPDPITGVDVVRRRAEHGWRSWGKQYYEGVPRAAYLQGPSKDPNAYLNSTENFMRSPNFILRKLGGDVSKLSKFTQ